MKESLSQNPLDVLKNIFHYHHFLDDQEAVVNRLLSGLDRHCLVMMPTGAGKSLCFQIPALCLTGGTIVISPLISLMKDQVDSLKDRGVKASFINSTVGKEEREARLEQFIYGDTKLLYITPERLKSPGFIDRIKRADIALLAVDEAHCISQWGNDFRPDYSLLGGYRNTLGNPLTIALTATATKEVQEDIISSLSLKREEVEVFHRGIRRPNLQLDAEEVTDDETKLDRIVKAAARNPGSGIVYFSLIKTLETFSALLDGLRIPHLVYHGKLDQRERKRVQNAFMKGSEIVLATNAFGMGIDKGDIRFIVHAEIPGSIESYYQEIGRAGRDGLESRCTMLYHQDDLLTHMDFIKWSHPEPSFYKKLYQFLKAETMKVNALGQDFLKEQLVFKNRFDFRLETAMGMLERFGVTSGSLNLRNLEVVKDLPPVLTDETAYELRINHARQKLLGIVNYFRTDMCRFNYIEEYFGISGEKTCRNCDNC